jgi:Glutamine amidotransferase domain
MVESMLRAMSARPWHSRRLVPGVDGALGAVHTSDRYSAVPGWFESPITGAHMVVAGAPVLPSSSIRSSLEEIVALPTDSAVAKLAEMDGNFAVVLWNPREHRLVVVTDPLGMQPLYMVRRPGMFALATEAKALTVGGACDYAMNPAAWGAVLSFGHPIAGLTLAESVVRVPAGAVVSFDLRNDDFSVRKIAAWPERREAREIDDRYVDDLADALVADVRACRQHHDNPALLLSGGYDSRLLLAALADLGLRPRLLTHAHDNELFGLESRIAVRIAAKYGLTVERLQSPPDFFSSQEYLGYLVASEASVPSLFLFISQLAAALPSDLEAVWEGTFPGALLFPIHQPPGGFDTYLARECASSTAPTWQAAQMVFAGEALEAMRAGFEETLSGERAKYSNDEHGVSEFAVRNRTRHRIAINPLQVFANDVLALTPGLTRAFWMRAASVPYELKAGHALYRRLLQRRFPTATRVPVVSAGRFHAFDRRSQREPFVSLTKLLQTPRVQRLLRRVGVRSGEYFWEPSRYVDTAVRATRASDPDLNAAGVARLQRQSPPYDYLSQTARALLFYRYMATEIFTGALTYGVEDKALAMADVG